MNKVKKYLGLVWIFIGIVSMILLLREAVTKISENPSHNVYLPWVIIIIIFIPIVLGFILFGWFAYKNEFNS